MHQMIESTTSKTGGQWRQIKFPTYSVQNLIHSDELLYADYIFFREPEQGLINESAFSMWYEAPFKVGEAEYRTVRQYFLAEKAKAFGDEETRINIINSQNPEEMEKLADSVKNFDTNVWDEVRYAIMLVGNYHKFWNNIELKKLLIESEDSVIVYAHPENLLWRNGVEESDTRAYTPQLWPGRNLLGFALMELRDHLNKFRKPV